MNAFANWLFSVLLGWTGTFANGIWNTVMNESGGISDFFSRFWLPIVLIMIIGGTVLDYTIWFIRWRPYLVWRSWLSRSRRQRDTREAARMLETTQMDDQTMNTIADWVATPQDQGPVYDMSQEAWQAQGYEPSYEAHAAYEPDYAQPQMMPADDWSPQEAPPHSAYEEIPYEQPVAKPLPFQPAYHDAEPPAFYQPEPVPQYWQQETAYAAPREQAQAQPGQPIGRRRRSERQRERAAAGFLTGLRERITSSDEEESMLDGLPAPIRQEDAFHEAVYPQGYRYQDQGRQDRGQ